MKFLKFLQHIGRSIARHKYLWTLLIFLLIVGFIDENSFWQRYRLIQENEATEAEVQEYEQRYNRDRNELRGLKSDPQARLRVARESHQMRSPDEDVYYIVTADTDSTTTAH